MIRYRATIVDRGDGFPLPVNHLIEVQAEIGVDLIQAAKDHWQEAYDGSKRTQVTCIKILDGSYQPEVGDEVMGKEARPQRTGAGVD